jgi:hypothetical protein
LNCHFFSHLAHLKVHIHPYCLIHQERDVLNFLVFERWCCAADCVNTCRKLSSCKIASRIRDDGSPLLGLCVAEGNLCARNNGVAWVVRRADNGSRGNLSVQTILRPAEDKKPKDRNLEQVFMSLPFFANLFAKRVRRSSGSPVSFPLK